MLNRPRPREHRDRKHPRDILDGDYSAASILAHAGELADCFEHDFQPGDNADD